MTDEKETSSPAAAPAGKPAGMSRDEIALELTRFIAGTTGLGKASTSAGFGGKSPKTTEEQVDALLQLFERCRTVVGKQDS